MHMHDIDIIRKDSFFRIIRQGNNEFFNAYHRKHSFEKVLSTLFIIYFTFRKRNVWLVEFLRCFPT